MASVDPERVELKISLGQMSRSGRRRCSGSGTVKRLRATIWFCDRPRWDADGVHLELFDRGVIVRMRHKRGDDSDTTVKYRRSAPLVLPSDWVPKRTSDFKVEGDWMTRSRKVAASLNATVAGKTIDKAGSPT
jgi:hypothetical protein